MKNMKHTLIEGDPLAPDGQDLVVQQVTHFTNDPLNAGPPPGVGWRCIGGNNIYNLWARVVRLDEARLEKQTGAIRKWLEDNETHGGRNAHDG